MEKGKRGRAPAAGVMGSDNPSQLLAPRGSIGAMDTLETVTGEREREPVGGVMDSDTPSQPADKKCRAGDLHLAFVADKEVAKEHAQ